MKKILLATLLLPFLSFSQRDYTALVNPFIGTGGHGHTYPGASMPFGMMQLSPDTRMADWDGSSGYHYSDNMIYGFSHSHLSGTGIPDYCDLLMMPYVGQTEWEPNEYKSPFYHETEKASPGYYEVLLEKHQIRAQLAASTRSGMHQYSFAPSLFSASILIDLKHRDEVIESYIEKVNEHEIRGFRRSRSWAKDQYFYFHIVFEQSIQTFFSNQTFNQPNLTRLEGKDVKAALSFALSPEKKLRAKVGISAVSAEGAKANLQAEIKGWNFDGVRKKAKAAWNKELSKIDVKGGTKDQQVSFYTALYHTFLAPNIFQDVDGKYRGTDLKIHQAKGFTNYSVFSLWDTYRAYHPLMTILNQKRTKDWVATFLNQYRNGGILPVWELAGNETYCMIGYHSVPVIVDAYQKGLIRGNENELLNAMIDYAESNRFGLKQYKEQGYISNDIEHESVSKTLEYAYDDWCIAQFARMIGRQSVYKRYIERAQYYKNVFDPSTKHMRGKLQGMWYSPFDAKEINNFFTEGNSWQYTFAVPQDINGLINLHGGKDSFASKLNELFTTSSATTGREQPDVTGLIGQYAQGNEPSHHMAYLFNYVGMPWRTQELISQINKEFYKNSPDGLIGNEDCGQMSAWYIFSAMGFYPVCPGNGEYVLGTPLFDEVNINLENGKKFTIKAHRNTPGAFYVRTTSKNGVLHTKSYINHTELMKGGRFDFYLADVPNTNWGTAKTDLRHSSIIGSEIVTVPYANVPSNKFRKSIEVTLSTITPEANIYYKISTDTSSSSFEKYFGPILLTDNKTISFYAEKKGKRSGTVSQKFYRIPEDRSITVSSKVHPMYTAGGPEALIDGITGTPNWRAGEWQSYFGEDLDAIIDLQQVKPIAYVGVHVLQDVSPWIVYPKEVIFYTSDDGKNFIEFAKVINTVQPSLAEAETQVLGKTVEVQARYIKVKVVNGGKLPEWHESAGNASHLFIDEIIIR
jgi:predicted alpha-1,2-mannosidase